MKETYDIVYTTTSFKKKLKKCLLILPILILAALILYIIVTSVINKVNTIKFNSMYSVKDPEKYSNYKIYDYHIECVDVGRGSKTVNRNDFDGKTKYHKIYYVSDDQFICLCRSRFPYYGRTVALIVLQNPDNYVDVFNEWKVKKVELLDGDKVINALTDQNIISDFKKFINSEKDENELINPSSYVGDHKAECYSMRISYEETDNIYWETTVYHYTSDGYGEFIYIRQMDSETGESSEASIANYPEIYNWLSSCFASLDAD